MQDREWADYSRLVVTGQDEADLSHASGGLFRGLQTGNLYAGRVGETELAVWGLTGSPQSAVFRLRTTLKAKVNAGIWPPTPGQMASFSCSYEAAFRATTHVALWQSLPQEDCFLDWTAPQAVKVPLRALDPVLTAASGIRPWTEALEGMRVLVVSPFAEIASHQVLRRDLLFRSDFVVLPQIDVVPLLPPQTQALEWGRSSWTANLVRCMRDIDSLAPHVDAALISAGSYGMPLASHAHSHGLPVVYMGGALQLLFGIGGARWSGSEALASITGPGWVRPERSLAPRGARLVERGAYW